MLNAPFGWLWNLLVLIGQWFLEWWSSRHWRCLLWGLPALVVIGFSTYFSLNAAVQTRVELSQKYVAAGRSAVVSSNWRTATLFLERALELGVRDREVLFDLANAADKSGDEARKIAVLNWLAPDDRPVYAPAHLWRAISALSTSPVPLEKQREAEQQLRYVLQMDSSNVNAHAILGELYFQRGFMDGAATHLARADKSVIHYQLLLAKACIFTGNLFAAEAAATLASELAVVKVGENPGDLESRLQLGEAYLILEQFPKAVATLTEGVRLQPEEQKIRAAISRVYLEWARSVQDGSGEALAKRTQAFQLVAVAMQWNAEDPNVFDEMMKLVELNDAAAEKAREFLRDNISTGRAVGISHLLLGTSLEKAGNLQEAGFHLEQSFKLLPEGPVVANNLAWHLVYMDPPETERAMKLIEAVIARFPNVPAYIDTRGHVYLKMKEWSKAVDDFQVSITQYANEPSVHSGLTEAYQNLGMFELATRHRKISEQLLSQRPQNAATPEVPQAPPE
jgi:tetratricopeptide (TPR) repeat protein